MSSEYELISKAIKKLKSEMKEDGYYILAKEKIIKALNELKKDNTTSYTPSGDYNPSTKKYVDDISGGGGGGGGGGITPVDAIDEQFNDVVDFDDIAFDGWTNINVVGDRKWKGKIYNEDKVFMIE